MYLLYNNLYKEKSYYFLISNMKNFNEILKIKNRKMLDNYQAENLILFSSFCTVLIFQSFYHTMMRFINNSFRSKYS